MNSSHYETSNVYLASFLRCQGMKLDGFERVSPRRVQFRFVAHEKIHELLRLYWGNVPLPLVPAALFASLRDLKSLIRRRPGKVVPADPSPPSPGPLVPTQPC